MAIRWTMSTRTSMGSRIATARVAVHFAIRGVYGHLFMVAGVRVAECSISCGQFRVEINDPSHDRPPLDFANVFSTETISHSVLMNG